MGVPCPARLFQHIHVITFDNVISRSAPPHTSPTSEPLPSTLEGNVDNQSNQTGYSGLFYVMLILGIIGVIGFLIVASGAAAGGM